MKSATRCPCLPGGHTDETDKPSGGWESDPGILTRYPLQPGKRAAKGEEGHELQKAKYGEDSASQEGARGASASPAVLRGQGLLGREEPSSVLLLMDFPPG